MPTEWHLFFELYTLAEWAIRVIMLVVITRNHRPSAAMAWLLVVFILPWVGLVLYLLFGARRPNAKRQAKHEQLIECLQKVGERIRPHAGQFLPELNQDNTRVEALIRKLGNMPALGNNRVELFTECTVFIDRLVEDISRAEHHVHLLFYIFEDDEIGNRVIDALAEAVQRGVTCRLLIDSLGSRKPLKRMSRRIRKAGIQLHDALPASLFRRYSGRVDIRNHRKIAVIDGITAYTGSQNIVDPSYGHKDLVWIDMMARLEGPVVIELQVMFVGDWFMESSEILTEEAYFPLPENKGTVSAQVLPSGPIYKTENYQRLVVSALHQAREQIIITSPYLIPDEVFLQAVEVAQLRGVQVNIVVPKQCDQRIPGFAAKAYYQELLEYGARIFLYDKGLLHVKTMTVDHSLSFFGSSNFDVRSFALNFEVNMAFFGDEETAVLLKIQNHYIEESCELTLEAWMKQPGRHPLLENIAKLMSPLL